MFGKSPPKLGEQQRLFKVRGGKNQEKNISQRREENRRGKGKRGKPQQVFLWAVGGMKGWVRDLRIWVTKKKKGFGKKKKPLLRTGGVTGGVQHQQPTNGKQG